MKLTNKTHYRTDDLRRFVLAGLKAKGVDSTNYRVEVVYTKKKDAWGWAYYNRPFFRLHMLKGEQARSLVPMKPCHYCLDLRRDERNDTIFCHDCWDRAKGYRGHEPLRTSTRTTAYEVFPHIKRLAQILCHEVDHNLGLRHGEMCRSNKQDVSWADGFEIHATEKKAAPPISDRVAKREQHARTMLAKAERKLKLARTLTKRWQAKVRYYDRKAAASPKESAS